MRTTPPTVPPAIAPTFDEGGDEEVFVAGDPNGDGGGVAGFGGVVLGGGGELDEGVVGDDALVVVGLYMLAANRIP